ncbi:blackelin-4-like [Ornithodoros turicata]|uniref:blackelin-4-like n=1 Tax=Ornithodoros turicata TaxID=34597 RepID=UPI003139EDF3
MTSVQSFLVGICVAIHTSVAYEYSYIDQLRMARTQADGGNPTEICHLPKAEGPCNGHFPVYYFDAHQGQCIEFIYGGCYGNLNNFDTYYECRKTCAARALFFYPLSLAAEQSAAAQRCHMQYARPYVPVSELSF